VLEPFFNEVAAGVTDPQTEVPLTERARAEIQVFGDEAQREELARRDDLRLVPLGSGSDYTPFLQHLGIASANLGFSGESEHGSYHTLYDTYAHFTRFRDPGFRYGVALSELAGLATLRLANAPQLPVRFSGLADNLALYLEELVKLAADARQAAQQRRQLLDDDVFALALDPTRGLGPPALLPDVPYFNFAPLENAVAAVTERARRVDAALSGAPLPASEALDRLLYRSERRLTDPAGLPGREWYRHQVYAPGFYTGYGVKTLPRVREAIEARLYDQVDAEIQATAAALDAFAGHLADIEALLVPGTARGR
jgi:N-acetylated-alpha-linked acidic dipeptidase